MYQKEQESVIRLLAANPGGLTRKELVQRIWPASYAVNSYDTPGRFQTVLNALLSDNLITRSLAQTVPFKVYRYYLVANIPF